MRPSWILPVAVALLAGCATYAPLQTATTVQPGRYRVGGQVTAAPYCTLTLTPTLCAEIPRDMTLPEVRLSGRTGLAERIDAGATVHGRFAGGQPLFGLALDAKVEAWSTPLESGRFLVSAGAGAGGTFGPGFQDLPGTTQVELVVPVFVALDRPGYELLLSPRFVQRIRFLDVTGTAAREPLFVSEIGLALGYVSKGSWLWGVQLEYHAPLAVPLRGPLTVTVGLLFDVG